MFVSAVPGMTPVIAPELERLPGIRVADTGFDGRTDLILLDAGRGARANLWTLRTIEDLFVEVGRTTLVGGERADSLARRMLRPEGVERALSIWSQEVRPLAGAMTYRVIARVLQEQAFVRTGLRQALSEVISRQRPRWRTADPAQVEVWVAEYRPGRFISGLRLSDASMRRHAVREVERRGSLRPSVAAAMIGLAGPPHGVLLDPCCGSGTVLREGLAAGWPSVRGTDIDPDAVTACGRNAPEAAVARGDARRLDMPAASVSAVVSNLPFGQQYGVQGNMRTWLADVLAEMARVTQPGGRVILLAPEIPRPCVPEHLRMARKTTLRLLGTATTLWVSARA